MNNIFELIGSYINTFIDRLTIENTVLIVNIIMFVLILVLLLNVFTDKPKTKAKIEKRNIFKTYDIKSIVIMIGAAAGITYVMKGITMTPITTYSLMLMLLIMMPSVIQSENKRIHQEDVFDDVILYCSNTAMLLKQDKEVYDVILRVRRDLKTALGNDLEELAIALQEGREQTQYVMKTMERNYPYSCVRNLNIILMFITFENSNFDDSLLEAYQNDLQELTIAVKDNKAKRKSLRIQYIFISVACIGAYYFFVQQMAISFDSGLDDKTFLFWNSMYIFAIFICLFMANRYFSANGTKE